MVTEDTKIELKKLQEFVQANPLPLYEQEACGKGDNFWCCDYWTKEVIDCLILGKEEYLAKPIPEQYINNENFEKNDITFAFDYKMKMLDKLSIVKDDCDNLLIAECGWLIDLILARQLKDWNTVCYDRGIYNEYLLNFYSNISCFSCSTHEYSNHCILNDKYILINNHSLVKEVTELFPKDMFIHVIWDGKLYW